ncbi:MAG: GAF domain-containing protein [Polyangiales bacterium]
MRWFVEITSLATSAPASRLTVEAATWQGALAQARNAQKDTAPLSNFTIEVLPDGYRATNGLARMRYVVSKAPDDAPLFSGDKPDSVPPDSKSPAAVAANVLGRRVSTGKNQPVPAPAAAAAPPVAPPAAPQPVVERGKIILRKAEEPGTRSPLTYRELAVAVVAGTPVPHALSIAKANLDDVKAELANAPAGKLVQLAVFDHEWSGRPQRAPLVALTWKDWRGGEPEVKYPSGSASGPTPPVNTLPSGREPAAAPIDAKGIASEISSAVAAARPAPVAPSQPEIPAAIESFVSSGSIQAAPQPAPPPPAPPPAPAPPPVAPAPAVAPAPPPATAVAPSVPPPSAPMSAPRSSRPDDLVSELFESMHDVHFMRDSLDGADFVLELLREKIPTRVALVHFFDINTKEFVVVKARAPKPDVLSSRSKEGSGLIGAAVNTGKPILIKDATSDTRWQRERYQQAGHAEPRQIVVAPMRQGGRYLGAIELADHEDGESFGDNEIHALAYVAEQFSEFVGERGIQLVAADTGSFQVIDQNAVRAPRAR